MVSGAGVRAYGLKVEHTFEDLVVWSGEGGSVFMFQSELPYHDANFSSVGCHILHPTSYLLHPTSYIVPLTSCIPHPTSYFLSLSLSSHC